MGKTRRGCIDKLQLTVKSREEDSPIIWLLTPANLQGKVSFPLNETSYLRKIASLQTRNLELKAFAPLHSIVLRAMAGASSWNLMKLQMVQARHTYTTVPTVQISLLVGESRLLIRRNNKFSTVLLQVEDALLRLKRQLALQPPLLDKAIQEVQQLRPLAAQALLELTSTLSKAG